MCRPRAVLIHGIDDARAVLNAARELGVAVVLASAPAAAASLGGGWWQALVRRMVSEYPDVQFSTVLDCAARADLVLGALRQGLADDRRTVLCYRGPAAVARRLDDIARQHGGELMRRRPPVLDLTEVSDRAGKLRAWLSKSGPAPAAG